MYVGWNYQLLVLLYELYENFFVSNASLLQTNNMAGHISYLRYISLLIND